MRSFDDYEDDMGTSPALDDATVDLILAGRARDADALLPLSTFVAEMRAWGNLPVPPPSAALASVLAEGVTAIDHGALPATGERETAAPAAGIFWLPKARKRILPNRRSGVTARLAAASLATKVGLGCTMATASVTGAAAAGVLPDPVQRAVAGVVRALTPFEVPDGARDGADSGGRIDPGASDQDPGVHGEPTLDDAPLSGDQRSPDPGQPASGGSAPGDTGAQSPGQAGPAPTGGSAPTTVPGDLAPADQYRPEDPLSGTPSTPTGQASTLPGDDVSQQPDQVPGSSPETTSTTQPATASTTQPATTSTTQSATTPTTPTTGARTGRR
jgi:Predicted solute binding protein